MPIIESSFVAKVARVGEISSFITLLAPLPSFVFCYRSIKYKEKQIARVSYTFLLGQAVVNTVWLSYSIKL